jgi:hypothetical protein
MSANRIDIEMTYEMMLYDTLGRIYCAGLRYNCLDDTRTPWKKLETR